MVKTRGCSFGYRDIDPQALGVSTRGVGPPDLLVGRRQSLAVSEGYVGKAAGLVIRGEKSHDFLGLIILSQHGFLFAADGILIRHADVGFTL